MRIFRVGAAIGLTILFVSCHARDVAAQTIDVVGDMSHNAFGTALAKANVYRVDATTTLREQEMRMNFLGPQTLIFSVYQSPVEFGSYSRIQTNSVASIGTGLDYYSSGPINVPLQEGSFYMMAVSWSGSSQYFFDDGSEQATSFGAHVHAYASGLHPLGASINNLGDDFAIYNQRLTTGIPEPSTLILALGACATIVRRRLAA